MTEPSRIPRDALNGVRIAISVSESADLARLGLTPKHCDLVVAELARAVIIAGGTIVYGGRLEPEGFTRIFLEEAGRFRYKNDAIELCLAQSEFGPISPKKLGKVDQRLGTAGSLTLVGVDGAVVPLANLGDLDGSAADVASSLTAMRTYVSSTTSARIVVGGRLSGYLGSEPGVIEEARLSAAGGSRLYVAGGYGGAAAALVKKVTPELMAWAPPEYPHGGDSPDVADSLERFASAVAGARNNGLELAERQILAASHRPADIAAIVVRGLAMSRQ